MNAHIHVEDYMNRQPVSIECGTPVKKLLDDMIKNGWIGAPVVDGKKLIGFVSEQDCIHKVLIASYHGETPPTVNEVMRSEVLTVAPSDNIIDLARQMEENKPKIYPVVQDGNLVGLIQRSDILKALMDNIDPHHPW